MFGSKVADKTENPIQKRKSNNPAGRPTRVPCRFDRDGNLIIKNHTFERGLQA